jgi:hypothetical protein
MCARPRSSGFERKPPGLDPGWIPVSAKKTRVHATAATHLQGNLFAFVSCRGLSGVFGASCGIRAPSDTRIPGKSDRRINSYLIVKVVPTPISSLSLRCCHRPQTALCNRRIYSVKFQRSQNRSVRCSLEMKATAVRTCFCRSGIYQLREWHRSSGNDLFPSIQRFRSIARRGSTSETPGLT